MSCLLASNLLICGTKSKHLHCPTTCECIFRETQLQEFASLLLAIGNGQLPVDAEGLVTIPSGCGKVVENVTELHNKVYPNLALNWKNHKWLCERAILAPRNDMVSMTNAQLLHILPGEEQLYRHSHGGF